MGLHRFHPEKSITKGPWRASFNGRSAAFNKSKARRVAIVMPEPELFTEKEKPTTASVVLELKPDEQVKREQVRGIVHLVACQRGRLKA